MFTGNMKNMGPRTIRVPAGYEVPIGFPYFMSQHADNATIFSRITKYLELNPRNSISFFQQADISDKNNLTWMFIETGTYLKYESVRFQSGKDDDVINLDNRFPRGTQREQLHTFLNITRVDDPRHSVPVSSDRKLLYTLMETKGPIHYPEGGGIVIMGGAVINKDGSVKLFNHGDSVVGQHRKHGNGSRDPAHTLVGEFLLPYWAIHFVRRRGSLIGLWCDPVNLHWATPEGKLLDKKQTPPEDN